MLCIFASRLPEFLAIWTRRQPCAQNTKSEDDSEESGGRLCEEYLNTELRESRLDVIEAREVVQRNARKSSSRARPERGCGNQHRAMGKTGSAPRTSEAFAEAPEDDCAEFRAATCQGLTDCTTHKRQEDDYDAVDDEEDVESDVASLLVFARWQKEKRRKSRQDHKRMLQWKIKSLLVRDEMLEARMLAEDA